MNGIDGHSIEDMKRIADRAINEGRPIELAEELGIPPETLLKWVVDRVRFLYPPIDYDAEDPPTQHVHELIDFEVMQQILRHPEGLKFLYWVDDLCIDKIDLGREHSRRSRGGKKRGMQKTAEKEAAEQPYQRMIEKELKKNVRALEDDNLPSRLFLRPDKEIPEAGRRDLEDIKKYVRGLRYQKDLVADELRQLPDIDDARLVANVRRRQEEIPKRHRRKLHWIQTAVTWLRLYTE